MVTPDPSNDEGWSRRKEGEDNRWDLKNIIKCGHRNDCKEGSTGREEIEALDRCTTGAH